MPQLDFNTYTSQIFWLIISFLILYFFIKNIAIPGLRSVDIKRQEFIGNDIQRASTLTKEADDIKQLVAVKFSKTKQNINKIIEDKIHELESDAIEKITALELELSKKETHLLAEIDHMRRNIDSIIEPIAVEISANICQSIFDLNLEKQEIKTEITKNER